MAELPSSTESKQNNSEILWELANTFTEEAQNAAKRKAVEQGYTLDRGGIPFEETLINLSRSRDVLLKSISDAAVPLLPLKIQTELVSDVRKVSTQLTALHAGADAVISFGSAVDDLTAGIWYSNLQNMSGEILGFQEKLNQLKTLEKTLRDLNQRAGAFRNSEERATKGLEQLDIILTNAKRSTESLAQVNADAQIKLDLTTANDLKAASSLLSAQQSEKSSAESAATARASSAEIDSLRMRASSSFSDLELTRNTYTQLTTEISAFRTQVEADLNQTQLSQKKVYADLDSRSQADFTRLFKTSEDNEKTQSLAMTTALTSAIESLKTRETAFSTEAAAAETMRVLNSSKQLSTSKSLFESEIAAIIATNKQVLKLAEARADAVVTNSEVWTKERSEALENLESIIREKIRLATNFQLFSAFNMRQLAIAQGKGFWQNALFVLVGLSFVLSSAFVIYLFYRNPSYDVAFFLKLSISIPIVYAIHFCSGEYSKERKLEEEYAFKANISISLEPYRELVEKMIDKGNPVEAAKYSDFVIASIEKVFTSPTQAIFGGGEKNVPTTDLSETSKGITKIIGSVSDVIQSLAKLK